MPKKKQIYKCNICGNVVEVLTAGPGELVCCGEPMELLSEKTQDEGLEKHVPVVEKIDGGIKVIVGSIEHPMDEKHFIEWIQVLANGKSYRKFLSPGDKPEATFMIEADSYTVREHCNIHGVWSTKA